MAFTTVYSQSCEHHLSLVLEHSITPKQSPVLLTIINLLSKDLPLLDSSY